MEDLLSAAQTKDESKTAGKSEVSQPEALDGENSRLGRRYSPRLSKYGHKDNVAVAEKQRKLEALLPCRITPLNPPSPVASSSTEDSVGNRVQDREANGPSESRKEDAKVKTGELNGEDVSTLNTSEESTPEPDINEDTETDKTPDQRKEMSDTDMPDMDSVPKNAPGACKIRSSAAVGLNEMMDIDTVDQVAQEAQIKGEDSLGLDTTCSASSASTNTEEKDQSSTTAAKRRKRLRKDAKATQAEAGSSPSTPFVKVKDEPADEFAETLISTASVKDEPNGTRGGLRIAAVFSAAPATEAQALSVLHPLSGHMFCSHCRKGLVKGQTAFQRRSSPALFCSTNCLTSFLPAVKRPSCQNCCKFISRPRDIILSPAGKDGLKEFCSQSCLSSFNSKNSDATQKPSQTVAPQSLCNMCSRRCISKHDVTQNETVHKLCSDACFKRFRAVKKISMTSCATCGSYCHNKPLLLLMDGSSPILCNAECLAKYKEKTKVNQPCMLCQTSRMLVDMAHHKNDDDTVILFCSSSCMMAHKVQIASASATRFDCDNCGKDRVPAYHLAMSDTSIRNFCTFPCVMAFQEKLRISQKEESCLTKLPMGPTQSQTAPPVQPRGELSKQAPKLNCFQCSCHLTSKPEVIQIKGKPVFVCSMQCSQEFKKANLVTSLCDHCKTEKTPTEEKRMNDKDCSFCSDDCMVLFRNELTKSWGKHCNSCAYCCCLSQKLVTARYGGSTEEFCSEDCRSKYTMLFCHVAKCDACGHKGKLKENLLMLGDVKHFCDLTCLLQFCSENVVAHEDVVNGPTDSTADATPVIANVVSLAAPPAQKTKTPTRASKRRAALKISKTIKVQTDKSSTQPPISPPTKVLKNKALLCRPLVQNKGISCTTQTVDCEAQTENTFPQVMVVPVPVPVYIPLPMNMYAQCTPRPLGVPLPLPVPMFLPVTMDSAERVLETIQEIKKKIPSDPFEAELILMAEMVAEENESGKGKSPKNKVVEKDNEKQEGPAPYDQRSNYSDDLDTEELASLFNSWEDTSSDPSLRTPIQPESQEKLKSEPNTVPEPHSEPPPPGSPSGACPLDIEADINFETLERMSHPKGIPQESPSSSPSALREQQSSRKTRDRKTKGRTSQRLSKASEATSKKECVQKKPAVLELPKLKSQYGVEAWKHWVKWRKSQPNLEKPRYGSRLMVLKEDVLQCTTAELSYGLCCFISEVKRPNGKPYSPDSLFYLCLGIQQYLFENGRVENIFMDPFYSKFSAEITCMLKDFRPSVTASGYIRSRVEEEFLWDCKQLGAYSPIVLLNTLLFFCCKYFGFTTAKQHRQLSFVHLIRCTKNTNNCTRTFLRFYPPLTTEETEPELPAKRRKEEEKKEETLEMMENTENPLRCPVRLFEFYLSKCSESVKQRSNVFYLLPERSCVPNSPLWFSTTPLEDSTMEAMLTRILSVRDLHVRPNVSDTSQPSDPSLQTPDDDDEDSE